MVDIVQLYETWCTFSIQLLQVYRRCLLVRLVVLAPVIWVSWFLNLRNALHVAVYLNARENPRNATHILEALLTYLKPTEMRWLNSDTFTIIILNWVTIIILNWVTIIILNWGKPNINAYNPINDFKSQFKIWLKPFKPYFDHVSYVDTIFAYLVKIQYWCNLRYISIIY